MQLIWVVILKMSQVLNLIMKLCISVFELLPSCSGPEGVETSCFTTDLDCVTPFECLACWSVAILGPQKLKRWKFQLENYLTDLTLAWKCIWYCSAVEKVDNASCSKQVYGSFHIELVALPVQTEHSLIASQNSELPTSTLQHTVFS